MHDQSLSHVTDSLPPITGARQVPLSMGLPWQDTGLGCHFLLQCFLPVSPILVAGFFTTVEMGMATHSSILAWRIPRTEQPGRQ